MARELDRLVRRGAAGLGDDAALAARFLGHDLDDALALFLGERPELAHDAGAEHAVDAERAGQVAHVGAQPRLVELEVGVNGVVMAAQMPRNCARDASLAWDFL